MKTQQMSHLTSFVQRRRVPIFFALAFTLSWLVWGSAIARYYGLLSFQLPDPLAYFGVSIAAFLVTAFADGRAGLRDLLRRMIRWQVNPVWYGITVGLPLALPVVAAVIYRSFGGSVPVGHLLPLEGAVAYFLFGIPFMLLTEETAWRGFALPQLEKVHGTLKASLILGLLWGVWHTPYFFLPGSSQSNFPYFGYVLMVVAQSMLYGWLRRHTGGSVLMAAIFHAATNATLAYVGIGFGDARAFWLMTAVTWVAAALVTFKAGPASKPYLSQQQETTPAAS